MVGGRFCCFFFAEGRDVHVHEYQEFALHCLRYWCGAFVSISALVLLLGQWGVLSEKTDGWPFSYWHRRESCPNRKASKSSYPFIVKRIVRLWSGVRSLQAVRSNLVCMAVITALICPSLKVWDRYIDIVDVLRKELCWIMKSKLNYDWSHGETR